MDAPFLYLPPWMAKGILDSDDILLPFQEGSRALIVASETQQSALFPLPRWSVTKYSVAGFPQISEDHWFPCPCSCSCRKPCRSVPSRGTRVPPGTRGLWNLSPSCTTCFGSPSENCKGQSRHKRHNCEGHIPFSLPSLLTLYFYSTEIAFLLCKWSSWLQVQHVLKIPCQVLNCFTFLGFCSCLFSWASITPLHQHSAHPSEL